ncbi:hypothetical protein ACFL1N_03635 [Thermodesulfobacteriota bacterium]
MHRFRNFWISGIFVLLAVFSLSSCNSQPVKDSSNILYEVLSPWGDADPKILKGISARLDNFSGKKIGLFANYKRAAVPIAMSLKEQLESKYQDSRFTIYHSDQWNVVEIETEKGERFKKWVEGNDAIILMVGD